MRAWERSGKDLQSGLSTGSNEPLVAMLGGLSIVDSHRYSEKRFFPRSLLGEVLLDVVFEHERVMEETGNNSENAIALSLKNSQREE